MADIGDKQTRSRMVSGIRGKNTKPEMVLRRALHARGFRYRLHGNLHISPIRSARAIHALDSAF